MAISLSHTQDLLQVLLLRVPQLHDLLPDRSCKGYAFAQGPEDAIM